MMQKHNKAKAHVMHKLHKMTICTPKCIAVQLRTNTLIQRSCTLNNKVEEGSQRRVTVEEGKWDLGGGGGSLLQREQKLEAVCVCGIELQVPLGNIAYHSLSHPAPSIHSQLQQQTHPERSVHIQAHKTGQQPLFWDTGQSRKANANYGWNLAGSCVFTSTQLITRAPNQAKRQGVELENKPG
jgi:hypothetical protein